ncbi:hypothetical protein K1719_008260 [Acacia pycnantha]|nr:hypothetical protein K1719_008260 [Acacia pycnantha]
MPGLVSVKTPSNAAPVRIPVSEAQTPHRIKTQPDAAPLHLPEPNPRRIERRSYLIPLTQLFLRQVQGGRASVGVGDSGSLSISDHGCSSVTPNFR